MYIYRKTTRRMKLLLWWCHIRSDMVSKDSMQRICSGEEGKIEIIIFKVSFPSVKMIDLLILIPLSSS